MRRRSASARRAGVSARGEADDGRAMAAGAGAWVEEGGRRKGKADEGNCKRRLRKISTAYGSTLRIRQKEKRRQEGGKGSRPQRCRPLLPVSGPEARFDG